MPCDCDTCRRVRGYMERRTITDRITEADRYTHLRHIIRDRKEPAQ